MAGTNHGPLIFVCYAHQDNVDTDPEKCWLNRLLVHLESLEEQQELAIWSDQQIQAGSHWQQEIKTTLRKAKAAVLLISPAFLNSSYIRNSELPVLLHRAKEQGVLILPLILRPCLLQEVFFKFPDPQQGPEKLSLASLQGINSLNKPLNGLSQTDQDAALVSVAKQLLLACPPEQSNRTEDIDVSAVNLATVTPNKCTEKRSQRTRFTIVLTATIDELDKPLAEALATHLRKISDDASLTIQATELGSIKLTLEASSHGFERIKSLFETGQIADILGFPVQSVTAYRSSMRVCVIGTGYVGLVTGVCLAHIGHHVICVDNNEEKVQLMQSGQSPIYEPGLSDLVKSSMASGNLEFTSDLSTGVSHGDILFIAVGTPALPTGESDTRYVEAVARGIGENLTDGYKVIVNKSTVPIGSGDWVRMIVLDGITERQKILVGAGAPAVDTEVSASFDVVSNPEFLREGSAIFDTFNPDRIVLGSNSDKAISMMKELYTPIVERQFAEDRDAPQVPVVVSDLSSAEMVKYASNAFLATKISFINEVANICDRVGADVTQVAQGIGLDSRIGSKFLQAGIGWGGSCFPKDVSALVHIADDYGYEAELLKATINVNTRQRVLSIEKLQQVLKILKGKTVGLLGLTFKPDTDDMRDAPALMMIENLNRLGAKVKAYDPIVSQSGISQGLSGVIVETDPESLADGCDALVLVTDWPQFQELDYGKMAKCMNAPVIIDGRNFLDQKDLEAKGFQYVGMGR